MRVLIAGGGIGGLTTALSLHAVGIEALIVDSVAELRPAGVGINLQPHAVRELTELGLGDELAALGIRTHDMHMCDRHGNAIMAVPRGARAGYAWPQYSIHRGELQMMLLATVRDRLGPDAVRTGTALEGYDEDEHGVVVRLRDRGTGAELTERADVLVGADGLFSTLRALLHPGEGHPLWNGVRMWRGTVEAEPFLDGRSMVVAGAISPARMVMYPIAERPDGRVLVNWVAEARVADGPLTPTDGADWTRRGRLADVLPFYADWELGFADLPALLAGTERILEYPMVDRDPLPFWSRGRVTLLGDAAHPMYPTGSNGGSQAVIDARTLAYRLAVADDPVSGLAAYDADRRPVTEALLLANREIPLDRVMVTVAERAPDGFARIEDVLDAHELAALAGSLRSTTDMDVEVLNTRPSLVP